MTTIQRAILLFVLAVAFCASAAAADRQPLVVAHRGLLTHAPENTLANFRACLELRLGFELDVQRTRDGHLVCIHDDTVDRTTNGTGKVAELSLEQIRRLDAGSWFDPRFVREKIPTVEEVLKLVAEYRQHDILVAVDLKDGTAAVEVVRMAEELDVLDRLLFIGKTISEPAIREQIRGASSKAQTAAVANDANEFPEALAASNANWVYVRFLPSKEQVDSVHRDGKKIFIAGPTVSGDVPENWRSAAEVGIDAILTDYPLELRTTLKKRAVTDLE